MQTVRKIPGVEEFVDQAKRVWTITMNLDAMKRVRDLVKVDLLSIIEGKLIDQLTADPIMLCDVLYAVCKPEADARGVSESDFKGTITGDTIDHGSWSLLDTIVDFFSAASNQVWREARPKQDAIFHAFNMRKNEEFRQLKQSGQLKGALARPASGDESIGAPVTPDSNQAACRCGI